MTKLHLSIHPSIQPTIYEHFLHTCPSNDDVRSVRRCPRYRSAGGPKTKGTKKKAKKSSLTIFLFFKAATVCETAIEVLHQRYTKKLSKQELSWQWLNYLTMSTAFEEMFLKHCCLDRLRQRTWSLWQNQPVFRWFSYPKVRHGGGNSCPKLTLSRLNLRGSS